MAMCVYNEAHLSYYSTRTPNLRNRILEIKKLVPRLKVLRQWWGWNFTLTNVIGLWYLLSAILSFFLNYAVNFTLQKLWTFESKSVTDVHHQMMKYFGMGIALLTLNTVMLYVLVEYVLLQYLLAQLILTVLLSIISYFVTSRIFKKK
jgi:putative flippase GtrA